jgi:hypothetical protein
MGKQQHPEFISSCRVVDHEGVPVLALPVGGVGWLLRSLSVDERQQVYWDAGGAVSLPDATSPARSALLEALATSAGVDAETAAVWLQQAQADGDALMAWLQTRLVFDL